MLEIRIKRILDSIIDEAYPHEDPVQMKRLKGYYIKILKKELKSSGGTYHPEGHRIDVYNPSLGGKFIARICIHELSHHIDLMLNGTTGHQKPFYEVYTKLIYASLDLGILKKEDFLGDSRLREQNKVKKIIENYVPKKVKNKPAEKKIIKVYNAYRFREFLKRNGYKWNQLEETWDKELADDMEVFLLEGQGIYSERNNKEPYYEVCIQNLYVDAVIPIVAFGNTYDCREVLKEHGFRFDRETKNWVKKVPTSKLPENIRELRDEYRFVGVGISAGQHKIL